MEVDIGYTVIQNYNIVHNVVNRTTTFNSLRPSDALMRQ